MTSLPSELIGRFALNEGSGTSTANAVGGSNGTFLGTAPLGTWVDGFPLPDLVPPTAPQNVGATDGNGRVTLAWDANTEVDLAGYYVYRNGSGTPLNPSALTSPIFTDDTVTNGLSYTYAVTAVDASTNESTPSTEVFGNPSALAGAGMQFNGTSQYVTLGPAAGLSALGAETFTLETWFKRTGAGIATNTGNGGISDAIPLITKGMAESEGSTVDMNYFLGISASTGTLVADFEDMATGGNHPAAGTTPISIDTTRWHHAAATWDGTKWSLYLDGTLDGEVTPVGGPFTPRYDSIQHAVIASALNSTGGVGTQTQGFFAGLMDEVRIWNYARTLPEIQTTMNQEIVSTPGLIGRWGFDEASGTTVASTARNIPGNAVGSPQWTAGYTFPPDLTPPAAPVNLVATPGNAQVSLAWDANTESDLAGYNVYRRTTITSFGAPLNGGTLLTDP